VREKHTLSLKLTTDIQNCSENFIIWLDSYGETSFDHQTFFAGPFGRKVKAIYYSNPILGTLAVSPMIFFEAFVPSARRIFWKKQRFPIADAHYAMGFALLAETTMDDRYYQRAVHFLQELKKSRSTQYQHYCWGYPFDWVTRNGTIRAYTPFITTLPYGYEAFENVYRIDKNDKWLDVMRSISDHAANDIKDFPIGEGVSTCGYFPDDDKGGVVNSSAYRAFLLTKASFDFSENRYWEIAERNLTFVLKNQQPNGSWYYAADSVRDFVDHFHTCFVLKALAKIEQLTGHEGCRKAIEKGVEYYVKHLFDEMGLPKPFSRAPRLTVYKKELYDYAECINLGVLLKGRFPELDKRMNDTLEDLLRRWRKPDGSFRSRNLYLRWDNVPMHRWAQSQVFRSLCFLLHQEKQRKDP
jgi:hypothetical protein